MPRPIATYTASDWLRLRPLTQSYKTWVWNRLDRRHAASPAPDAQAMQRLLGDLDGKNIIASIAFNSPWTIAWQLRFVVRHLENAAFLIADNSNDEAARVKIAELCTDAGIACVQLPANPYKDLRYASRSHGLALNWVYHNIVRRLRPAAWGFFDHDLFPTRPYDPEKRLRGQPFYGEIVSRPGGTYLWPGYSLFSRDADRDEPLDFRQDWFLGLDTGGMSAALLTGHPDFASMRFAASRSIGPRRNVAVTIEDIDWFDDCVHLGNASGWYRSNKEREPALDLLLQQIYDGVLTAPARGASPASAGEGDHAKRGGGGDSTAAPWPA